MKVSHAISLGLITLLFSTLNTQAMANAPTAAPPPPPDQMVQLSSVGHLVTHDKRISRFKALVHQAKLESVLHAHGAMTLFAPSNEALAELPKSISHKLEHDVKFRKAFIMSHLFSGKMSTDFLKKTDTIRAMTAREYIIRKESDAVLVGNQSFLAHDINASNGMLHIVNGPLAQAD